MPSDYVTRFRATGGDGKTYFHAHVRFDLKRLSPHGRILFKFCECLFNRVYAPNPLKKKYIHIYMVLITVAEMLGQGRIALPNSDGVPQVNNTQLTRKDRELWNITTKALRHLGVILVVDVFFHYLYILTIPSDMKLVSKLSDWSLGELEIYGVSR